MRRSGRAPTRGSLRTPLSTSSLDEPFADLISAMPAGSRVLLFANQDTRDYPLFRPREGFLNRVVPWGNEAPTPESVVHRLQVMDSTHVLFVADEWLVRHWTPPVRVAETIGALAGSGIFRELPAPPGGMRLFEVGRSVEGRDFDAPRRPGDGSKPRP